jgi:hypothetical protein
MAERAMTLPLANLTLSPSVAASAGALVARPSST